MMVAKKALSYNTYMKINILADEVASQIAAGEVIERPASVVKELIENSIDAGADRISIRIEDAGKRLIEVSDNGLGIANEELAMAVARHATSKLSKADDLFHISTLGFRGEALASVGSVSRLTLVSRIANREIGSRLMVEAGRILSQENTGGVQGTLVKVENLFFNTPARLKFLKKDLTERQQIDGLVTRYAMAYPRIAFRLIEDSKPILTTTGNGNRREILAQLYGVDLARQLLEVVFEEEGFSIFGFISPISISRSNRKDITFFVNGRWVQDASLTMALIKAYQTYLMVGRFPLAFLFIQLDPEYVDVNVHPAKAEVRFRQPDLVFTSLQRAVKRAIIAYSPVPRISPPQWKLAAQPGFQGTEPAMPELTLDNKGVNFPEGEVGGIGNEPKPTTVFTSIPLLRLIGQIGATYLVAEGPDGLYLIDQHAAHERVLYEKLSGYNGNVPSQALIEPVLMQFPPQSAKVLHENLVVLQKIGFQVEEFGANSFRLRSIPVIFGGGDPRSAIQSIVEEFEEDETPLQGLQEAKLTARICKRMAVKGGTLLSLEEQKKLLLDLQACSSPRTCPHGRPTMIHLSVDLLERQFGRRGARAT